MALTSTSGNRSKIRHFMKQKWPCILTCNLDTIYIFKIHSKDLLQNNNFHITSSIFLLSSVSIPSLIVSLLPEFLGVLPEFFQTGGAAAPPAPLANTPMYTAELFRNQIGPPRASFAFCTTGGAHVNVWQEGKNG